MVARLKAYLEKRFEELGFQKTDLGYMLPGIAPDKIEEAIENRRKSEKPPLPKVTGTWMNYEGQIKIQSDQDIMMP